MKIDEIDIKLINMLQENSKRPIKNLAAELNLSIAPVHERIKKIEKSGIIRRYVAIVDLESINKSLINYCSVSIKQHNAQYFNEFEEKAREMDEILECYYVSGNYDYLLKVISGDMADYQNFVLNKLSKLKMIGNINSQFVMKHVKYKTSIKLSYKE